VYVRAAGGRQFTYFGVSEAARGTTDPDWRKQFSFSHAAESGNRGGRDVRGGGYDVQMNRNGNGGGGGGAQSVAELRFDMYDTDGRSGGGGGGGGNDAGRPSPRDFLGSVLCSVTDLVRLARSRKHQTQYNVLDRNGRHANNRRATLLVTTALDDAGAADTRNMFGALDAERGKAHVLEMTVQCRALPKMDTFSKTDPVVVLYKRNADTQKWERLNETERLQDNHNPDFRRALKLTFFDKDLNVNG
jgi:hypothetical protein